MDCGGPAKEVSEGNNISSSATDHFCDILAKHLATFCPYPNNLPETKLKNNGLNSLAEEIFRNSLILTLSHINDHSYTGLQ